MEDKKNIYCKFRYKCGICGKEHESVLERAKCEIACTEKKAEEERKAAELKMEAEYASRKAEVDAAFDNAYELRDKFLNDYGSYNYSKTVSNSRGLYFPFSWLWE